MILQLFYDNQTIESDFYLKKKKLLVARMSGSKEEKYHMKDFPSTSSSIHRNNIICSCGAILKTGSCTCLFVMLSNMPSVPKIISINDIA